MIDPAYATLLVPVVGGVVTAAGLWVKEWQLARDKTAVRESAIADANAEVAFATEWWNATRLLGSDAPADGPERMAVFLADAEALVAGTQHLAAVPRNPVTLSRVLLLYPMHRRSARILKWLYFVGLFFLFSTAFALASDMASSKSTDNSFVVGDIVGLIGIMFLVLVLRIAATNLEHGTRETLAAPAVGAIGPTAPRSSLPGTITADGQPAAVVDLTQLDEPAPTTSSSSKTH